MNRAQQLKSAQITALQQREETLKGRILSAIDKEHLSLPHLSQGQHGGGPSLADLVQFLLDSVRRGGAGGAGGGSSNSRLQPQSSSQQQQQQQYQSSRPVQMVEEMIRPVSTTMLQRGSDHQDNNRYDDSINQERGYHPHSRDRDRSSTPPRHQPVLLKRSSSPPAAAVRSQSHHSQQPQVRHSAPAVSHSTGRVINDHDLLSTISERESRSLQARNNSKVTMAMMINEQQQFDDNNSSNRGGAAGPSSAAQALQNRLRKAQQAFIAMRSSSS